MTEYSKRIVLLKIVYSDGSSLKLEGEDAVWLVRQVDSLIAKVVQNVNQRNQAALLGVDTAT